MSEIDINNTRQIHMVLALYPLREELRGGGAPSEEGAKPPSQPPYRLGLAEQDEMEEQVKDLLAQGFIGPSASLYGTPILFIPKKDGS